MENLADLVEKAKRNTGDMELLIERFTPLIRHLAHRLPYEYQDAEQDMKLTFLQLIHKIDLEEMRSREDKYLLGYIATAMKNRCFDLRNKYYREKSCEQALDDMVSLPQDNDILFEEMIELEQFCSFLTKLQKQILVAEYVYGYSDVELSRKLHTTRRAVNRTKNRAIDMLRNFYGKQN